MVMAAWLFQTMLWSAEDILRNSSQNKFIELLPNTETYKNLYFCRTVKDWNVLPSEIVNNKSAIDWKKFYLSILVNHEFKYCTIINTLIFLFILSFTRFCHCYHYC